LEIATQAAEKGLAWLKESGAIYGLDVNKVDIVRLDIASECQCVLGQLGPGYSYMVVRLMNAGAISSDQREAYDWLIEHGFKAAGWFDGATGAFASRPQYDELNAAWTRVLAADRAQ